MSVIDWSAKPEPWCWIGEQFRRECEQIADGSDVALLPWRALRERRKRLGLTQQQLADIAGLNIQRQIAHAELGERRPHPRHLAALAEAERK